MPKVSIIVPCWGVEKYLDRCVESLVNQTLKDIEIILVDDKSPDKTPELCDKWGKRDSRIKVVHKPVNEGLGMACNSGLHVATGEYVAFCDSDDWVELNMYEEMYKEANTNNFDIVYTGLKRVDTEGNVLGYLPHPTERQEYCDSSSILSYTKDMIGTSPRCKNERSIQVSAKVVLYRNKLIKDDNLRFVSERQYPSEDLMFNVDILSKATKVCVLPKFFYNYLVNTASISRTINTHKFTLFKQLYQEMIKRYSPLDKTCDINIRIQKMYIGYVRSYISQICKSNLEYVEKKELVKSICGDSDWKNIYKDFPVNELPLKRRFITWCMKYNLSAILVATLSHV